MHHFYNTSFVSNITDGFQKPHSAYSVSLRKTMSENNQQFNQNEKNMNWNFVNLIPCLEYEHNTKDSKDQRHRQRQPLPNSPIVRLLPTKECSPRWPCWSGTIHWKREEQISNLGDGKTQNISADADIIWQGNKSHPLVRVADGAFLRICRGSGRMRTARQANKQSALKTPLLHAERGFPAKLSSTIRQSHFFRSSTRHWRPTPCVIRHLRRLSAILCQNERNEFVHQQPGSARAHHGVGESSSHFWSTAKAPTWPTCGRTTFVCAVDPKTEDWMLKRPPGRGGQQVPMFVRIKSQRLARRETKHTLVFPTAHPKSSFQ